MVIQWTLYMANITAGAMKKLLSKWVGRYVNWGD